MAVLDERNGASQISRPCLDLLDNFVSGFDDLVYEIAEQVSRDRTQTAADEPVVIEVQDVRQAVGSVVQMVREQMKDSPEPLKTTLGSLMARLEQDAKGQ